MIQKTLPEVHPTLMCNVPRFWEKVYAGVHEKINSSSSTMKKIFLDAIETGRKYNLEYKNKSIPAPFGLKLKFEMYNKTVFNLLKRVLGIERGRFSRWPVRRSRIRSMNFCSLSISLLCMVTV